MPGALFSIPNDVVMISCYVPPESSLFYDNLNECEKNGILILEELMCEICIKYPNCSYLFWVI